MIARDRAGIVFADLPPELQADIIVCALEDNPHPLYLLSVNSTFYDAAARSIYTDLRFKSPRQLQQFAHVTTPPPRHPRSFSVKFSGGIADFQVFQHVLAAVRRCRLGWNDEEQLPLDHMSLCLHSHALNPHLRQVYEALSLVNPRTFSWTGPDPDHHFSTAIVPTATSHVFRAIGTWSRIEHITITNIAFPSDDPGLQLEAPEAFRLIHDEKPLLPPIKSLRTLYLGQATMLRPMTIAAMVCTPGQDNLQIVRLVDTYKESIWGPRIRRTDIENTAKELHITGTSPEERIMRVRQVVRCEALTERIMGGDRVEGLTTLE